MKKGIVILLLGIWVLINFVSAEIIFQDNFDYSSSNLSSGWYQGDWRKSSNMGIFPYLSVADCISPNCVELGENGGFVIPPVEGASILESKNINITDFENVTLSYFRKVSLINETNRFVAIWRANGGLANFIEDIRGEYTNDNYTKIQIIIPQNQSNLEVSFYVFLNDNNSKVMLDNFSIIGLKKFQCKDSDKDGICDPKDKCTKTPLATPVDQNGCSQMQFCSMQSICGSGCDWADWKNNAQFGTNPHDCTTVLVEKAGKISPRCAMLFGDGCGI